MRFGISLRKRLWVRSQVSIALSAILLLRRAAAQSTVVALLLLGAPAGVSAQTTYGEEAAQRIRAAERVAPLEDTMFGEQISLYNGSTKFRVVDVSLPSSDGLKVEFARNIGEFDISENFYVWDIDVPRITTLMPRTWTGGWTPDPPETAYNEQGVEFLKREYWQGFRLTTSSGTENLLYRGTDPRITLPALPGEFRFMTKSGWALQAVPAASGVGNTVIAHAPDGTKYHFDHLVTFPDHGAVQHLTKFNQSVPAILRRQKMVLFVSKVEDRFGNWVRYQWAGAKLLRIHANDGREIVIASDKVLPELSETEDSRYVLREIAVNGRVWKYNWDPSSPGREVVNPDGSTWSYEFSPGFGSPIDYQRSVKVYDLDRMVWYDKSLLYDIIPCSKGYDFTPGQQRVLKIKHPSGATAEYQFVPMRHGRTNVPYACIQRGDNPDEWNNRLSTFDDVFSLVSKTVSGPGLITKNTTYTYAGLEPAFAGDAPPPNDKDVTVREADGSFKTLVFGRDWGLNEGILLSTSEYSPQGSLVRRTDNSYLTTDDVATQPFPLAVGWSGVALGDGFAAFNLPLRSSVVQQDGASFSNVVNTFDVFARHANVTRSSSLGYSKTDGTTYHDDLAKWVLGQVKTTTTNGIEVSRTDYDANALPWKIYRFGKLQQTLAYYPDGTLATVKDGNNNVTTLASWYRGIPRLIGHPATVESPGGTTESAIVNDSGWITSVADENGFVTGYGYDAMGRLASIAYPTGDSTVWNTTTLTFAPVATDEYGIAGGHWKQTVSTGNSRRITYFDALWRPVVTQEYDAANQPGTQRFQRYAYDLSGRVSFASYPGAVDTLTTGTWSLYDALGRTTSVSQDSEYGRLTTTTAYLDGFQVRVTSPKQQSTTSRYLAWDQPSTELPVAITHPQGAFTDITRDVFGKPTALTRRNASHSTSLTRYYVYDIHQQLCKTIEPETGATVMAYDGAGNLAWSRSGSSYTSVASCNTTDIPALEHTTRSYDARNRVLSLSFPDSLGNTSYGYTPDGQLAQITVNNGTDNVSSSYSYNRRRLPISETIGVGSHLWGTGYGYNANGHLAAHSLPGGLAVDYAPDALGQPTRAGTYATGVSYFPNGALKQFTYGNGIVHTLTQNARGLPEHSRDAYGSTAVHDDSLDFDAHGNVAAISDGLLEGRGNRDMTYDALDRLTGVMSPMFGAASYTYDELDNLRTVQLTAGPKVRDHTYYYDANHRLTNIINTSGGATVAGLGYDAQGNLANKNGVLHRFDYGNRLREVVGVEQYRYDGHGRRVQAIRNGASIYSVYGQDGVLRFQRDERTGKNTQYVSLAGSLVAQLEDAIPLATPTLTVPGYSSSGNYTVSWASAAVASKYQLQEQANGGSWTLIHDAAGTSRAISGKPAGSYGYQVRACSATGCGNWSVTATTTVQLPPTTAPTLSVPSTGLNGSYTVSWIAVAAADRYQLQEQFNGGSWTTVHDAAGTSQALSGKATGSWGYQVRACNAAGCGAYSAIGTVQVLYPPASAPMLTVPATSPTGSYSASWTAVAAATTYELEEQIDGGSWTLIQDTSAASRALADKATGAYGYRVRACNSAGCGAYSAIGTVQVTLPLAAPSLNGPTRTTSDFATLTWTTVTTATRYELQQSRNKLAWSTIYNAAGTSMTLQPRAGRFHYQVRACTDAVCSPYSTIHTVVMTGATL